MSSADLRQEYAATPPEHAKAPLSTEPLAGGRAPFVPYVHRTQHQGVEAVHIDATVNCLRALGYEVDVIAPNPAPTGSTPQLRRRTLRSRIFSGISAWCPEFV